MKKEKNKGGDAMHCIIYYFPTYRQNNNNNNNNKNKNSLQSIDYSSTAILSPK